MGVKDLAKRGSVIVLAQNIVALTFLNPITRWPSFRGYSPSEFHQRNYIATRQEC